MEAARDGATALRRIHADPPDLLLLDLRLPDMDGLRVLDIVRGLYPELAVIIMTGHSSEPVAIAAANLAVSGYLVKPFGVHDLRQAVGTALARRLGRWLETSDAWAIHAAAATANGASCPAHASPMDPALPSSAPGRRRRLPRIVGQTRRQSERHTRIEHRLATAKALLAETTDPIKAIAAELGFHDAAHFCRQFRHWVGQTPLGYRRGQRASRVS